MKKNLWVKSNKKAHKKWNLTPILQKWNSSVQIRFPYFDYPLEMDVWIPILILLQWPFPGSRFDTWIRLRRFFQGIKLSFFSERTEGTSTDDNEEKWFKIDINFQGRLLWDTECIPKCIKNISMKLFFYFLYLSLFSLSWFPVTLFRRRPLTQGKQIEFLNLVLVGFLPMYLHDLHSLKVQFLTYLFQLAFHPHVDRLFKKSAKNRDLKKIH